MMHMQNILTRLSGCPPVRWILDALGMKVALFYFFLEKRAFVDLFHMNARVVGLGPYIRLLDRFDFTVPLRK